MKLTYTISTVNGNIPDGTFKTLAGAKEGARGMIVTAANTLHMPWWKVAFVWLTMRPCETSIKFNDDRSNVEVEYHFWLADRTLTSVAMLAIQTLKNEGVDAPKAVKITP